MCCASKLALLVLHAARYLQKHKIFLPQATVVVADVS